MRLWVHLFHRYEHRELDGARTWVEPDTSTSAYNFSEVYVLGGAHLAFRSDSLQNSVDVDIEYVHGDKTGWL